MAVGQTNVAVIGSGEVFGNGKAFPHGSRLGRPQGFLFYRCRGVSVENIRHADGVVFENVNVKVLGKEVRPETGGCVARVQRRCFDAVAAFFRQ